MKRKIEITEEIVDESEVIRGMIGINGMNAPMNLISDTTIDENIVDTQLSSKLGNGKLILAQIESI